MIQPFQIQRTLADKYIINNENRRLSLLQICRETFQKLNKVNVPSIAPKLWPLKRLRYFLLRRYIYSLIFSFQLLKTIP